MMRLLVGCLVSTWAVTAWADSPIAAKVGEDTISVAEVHNEMRMVLKDRVLSEAERRTIEAQTLGLLVNRQLVVRFLESKMIGASEADINQTMDEVKAKLAQQKRTLPDYLKSIGITEADMRRSLSWELGWPKYVSAKYTPKNLSAYFENYRRHFDGTQLQVRHILFKVDPTAENSTVKSVAEQAMKIREEIVAGKMTFEEAAKKHSQAATAAQGGELGMIGRHAPMPASFNDAAYDLKPGNISGPIVTHFGVHLIQCVKEQPGTLTLADAEVEKTVKEEMTRYLFNLIAENERKTKKIVFTGNLSYLKPGTGELVASGGPTAPAPEAVVDPAVKTPVEAKIPEMK
jgi:parvulin-like peptidyl-prolyl isomerase